MVVFDVTRVSTFEAVQKWKNDIDAKVLLPPDNRPIPVVLLANKCDLAKEGICQDKRQMDKFCEDNGFIGWFVFHFFFYFTFAVIFFCSFIN